MAARAACFEKQKLAGLSQVDLSKKGSIDDQIIDLVKYINGKENYFTTSSCSGRIVVFSELANQRKKCCHWHYVTHNKANADEVLCSLRGCQGDAVFKFEPFVLHVQCKDLEDGQDMLKTALVSGFKNSGIVVGKKANVIVAVRSTQSLEVPLVHNGKLLVSDEYIKFVVNAANKKLEENQTRIDSSPICWTCVSKMAVLHARKKVQDRKGKIQPNVNQQFILLTMEHLNPIMMWNSAVMTI
ncbi:tRNA wybutosine-synthesizing protein 3 homolog isoform X3 [Montipora capricornis]|uniref:tRNA wybutosine-synthesizing protein 3 homolog isoform X3 n=1 Tax=Montipora capricornis TaxID=246305 RepID=UPI0035F1980F